VTLWNLAFVGISEIFLQVSRCGFVTSGVASRPHGETEQYLEELEDAISLGTVLEEDPPFVNSPQI
jgi:hypothetical protein